MLFIVTPHLCKVALDDLAAEFCQVHFVPPSAGLFVSGKVNSHSSEALEVLKAHCLVDVKEERFKLLLKQIKAIVMLWIFIALLSIVNCMNVFTSVQLLAMSM